GDDGDDALVRDASGEAVEGLPGLEAQRDALAARLRNGLLDAAIAHALGDEEAIEVARFGVARLQDRVYPANKVHATPSWSGERWRWRRCPRHDRWLPSRPCFLPLRRRAPSPAPGSGRARRASYLCRGRGRVPRRSPSRRRSPPRSRARPRGAPRARAMAARPLRRPHRLAEPLEGHRFVGKDHVVAERLVVRATEQGDAKPLGRLRRAELAAVERLHDPVVAETLDGVDEAEHGDGGAMLAGRLGDRPEPGA